MHVGIDLGGINIAIGLVDEEYNLLAKGSVPTVRERAFSDIMKDAAQLIQRLLTETGKTVNDIQSIGMGSPGTLDVKKKTIVKACSFPKVHHSNVGTEIEKYFPGIPVYVGNDANAAAYGEILAGTSKGLANAVMVTLGTGVGGGIIIDNKIYAGFNHAGAELGHMVLNFNGPKCNCGRSGCFECYASATALIKQTADMIQSYPDSIIHEMINHDPAKISGKTAFDAAKQGDRAGQKIVGKYIEYLGVGLLNIIHIFQPEAIIIGGGICKEGDYLLNPLNEYINQYIVTTDIPRTKLMTASLGNDAGIIGAAMLWKQQDK
ncbi:MAG: ROK family protein [Ruminococcaceae bacterium]|nr:ROK family protein [Oscillospiraceae bacterium]